MANTNDAVTTGLVELDEGQRAYIDGLREFADFLEANPHLRNLSGGFYECCYFNSREKLIEATKLAGGIWEKNTAGGGYFRLTRQFGPFTFAIYTDELVTERPCRACGGKGGTLDWTRGSRMPDPQTERVCERCEGTGIEGAI